jgi:hypothetical protein
MDIALLLQRCELGGSCRNDILSPDAVEALEAAFCGS